MTSIPRDSSAPSTSLARVSLPFDPIDEAARQWGMRWESVKPMHAVTSIMRVQQLLISQLDGMLKPHGLSFARYEARVLLTFSSRGSLPLGKMGERLQVHPTSITSIIHRLVADGLVERQPHPEDGRAVLAVITAIAAPGFTGRELDRTLAAFARIPADGLRAAVECLPTHDVSDRLSEIASPTLVVVGELDEETPVAYAEQIASAIPGARLEVIPGVGHLAPAEAPEQFNALVGEFLSADSSG